MINGQSIMVKKTTHATFETITVWKHAHVLTINIHKLTNNFPDHELYGLTSQIRRSSGSIGANIAEGFARHSTNELIRFLYNARGSNAETICHLLLSRDLKYISKEDYLELRNKCDEIGKQLNGWIKSLKAKI